MHRSPWLSILLVLTVLVTPLAGLFLAPAVADAAPLAQTATTDDEIVVIESGTGRIRIDDPYTAPAHKPVVWNSGPDTGFTAVAAGDFNGDGDQELVAVGGLRLKVFDPVVPTGAAAADFSVSLTAGRAFRLIVTGDFDGDGRDEIAATEYAGSSENLRIFDGGTNGTAGQWTQVLAANYGALWADMTTGDMNADGADDLMLVRVPGSQVTLYNGRSVAAGSLGLLAEKNYNFPWLAAAMGDISKIYPGSEVALSRDKVQGAFDSVIIFRLAGTTFEDLPQENVTNRKFNPYFRSVATGDVNGDLDDEIVLLRDPQVDNVSLIVMNPNGQVMRTFEQRTGYSSTQFKLVRAGDIDADGRDEIVILRGDRYRAYTQPELSDAFVDVTGAFYTTATVSNLPTMALANVDGTGQVLGPTLSVTPTSLTFDLEYRQVSTPQTLSIRNTGTPAAINWSAQVLTGAPWLQLSKTSGVTNDTTDVNVNTQSVAPGTYTATIRFTSNTPGVVNNTQDVVVTLNLTGVGMVVVPNRLAFEVQYGGTQEQTVSIASAGGSAQFGWQATVLQGGTWLSVSPGQGTSPSNLRVIANSVAAGIGAKQGTIRIDALDPQIANGTQYVTVDLNVPDPGFVVLPKSISILQQRTGPTVVRQVSIWRPGASVNWVASALPAGAASEGSAPDGAAVPPPDWLVFTPDQGTTQPNVPSIMNVSVKPGTPNGRYHAIITIVASDESLPNRVQTVEVTAIVAEKVSKTFLPLVMN